MTSLALAAGIPIAWNDTRDDLIFDPVLSIKTIKPRLRGELRPVLACDADCEPADGIQYWMYNGISLPEHEAAFARCGIQYELTLIYPKRLGNQYSKTHGHCHTFPIGSPHNYPEVCEILWGEAQFIFHTLNLEARSASFCYAVHAKPGDKVVVPPNLHHLTINPLDELLLFSDLICTQTTGDYAGLAAMQGGAYLFDEQGWHPNPTYHAVAPLQHFEAEEFPEMGLTRAVPLYELIWRAPETLAWLSDPAAFPAAFPSLWARLPHEVRGGEING
ncbi:MAG: glucose-6-phosphate isomerase family protein [Aggregatilineales bacterium]